MHCYIQCPYPCSGPLLTHASARDSWTLLGKSGSVSCGVIALGNSMLIVSWDERRGINCHFLLLGTLFWTKTKALGHLESENEVTHYWLFATPWSVAYQAFPSMGFSSQESWSGLPFSSPGDLHNPGIKPGSPTLQTGALPSEPPGKHLIHA